jgi:hypothetical protein
MVSPARDCATAHRPSCPYRTPLRHQRPILGPQDPAKTIYHIKEADAYLSSPDPEQRTELARAAHVSLTVGLGWWRAMEVFSLRWAYIAVTEPGDGAAMDLPPDTGAVSLACRPRPSRISLVPLI